MWTGRLKDGSVWLYNFCVGNRMVQKLANLERRGKWFTNGHNHKKKLESHEKKRIDLRENIYRAKDADEGSDNK